MVLDLLDVWSIIAHYVFNTFHVYMHARTHLHERTHARAAPTHASTTRTHALFARVHMQVPGGANKKCSMPVGLAPVPHP